MNFFGTASLKWQPFDHKADIEPEGKFEKLEIEFKDKKSLFITFALLRCVFLSGSLFLVLQYGQVFDDGP